MTEWALRIGVTVIFSSVALLVVYVAHPPDKVLDLITTLVGTLAGALLAALSAFGSFTFNAMKMRRGENSNSMRR